MGADSSKPEVLHTTDQALFAYYVPETASIVAVCRSSFENFNVQSGNRRAVTHVQQVCNCVAATDDKSRFICGGEDGRLRVFDCSRNLLLATIPSLEAGESEHITAAIRSLLCAGDYVFAGGADGVVRQWNLASGDMVKSLPEGGEDLEEGPPAPVTAMAYDSTSSALIVGRANGHITSYDINTGKEIRQYEGHKGSVLALGVSEACGVLVSTATDSTLRIWNNGSGVELCGYEARALSVAVDETRDMLFVGLQDGKMSVSALFYNTTKQSIDVKVHKRVQAHRGAVAGIRYRAEHDFLVTVGADKTVRMWPSIMGQDPVAASEPGPVGTRMLSDDDIGKFLTNLEEQRVEEPSNPAEMARIKEQQRLFDMHLRLLQENGSEKSAVVRDKMEKDFEAAQKSLQDRLAQVARQYSEAKEGLRSKYEGVLNPEVGARLLEDKLAKQEEELLARHAKELEELRARADGERKRRQEQLPMARRQVAAEMMAMASKREVFEMDLEHDTAVALRAAIAKAFPPGSLLNDRYQIAYPVHTEASTVFAALDLTNGSHAAVKVFPANLNLITTLRHDGLVPVVDVVNTTRNSFLIMPHIKENLQSFVRREGEMEEAQIATIMKTLLETLAYLHSTGMVHRDVRPVNILMHEGTPMVCHFGVMKQLTGMESSEDGMVYAAPELFARVVMTASDIWSCGAVLLYLLSKGTFENPPFHGNSQREVLESMVKVVGKPPSTVVESIARDAMMKEDGVELYRHVAAMVEEENTPMDQLVPEASALALDLLRRMMAFNPQMRITAEEALEHGFFQQFEEGGICDPPPTTSNVPAARAQNDDKVAELMQQATTEKAESEQKTIENQKKMEKEKAEKEKAYKEKAEKEKQEKEKAEKEKEEKEKAETEKAEKEKVEKEMAEKEKAEKEKAEKERAEKEKAEKEKAEKEKAEKEEAEKEKAEKEKAEKEKAEKEKAEKEKAEKEKAEEMAEMEKTEKEKAAKEEVERAKKEQAEKQAETEEAGMEKEKDRGGKGGPGDLELGAGEAAGAEEEDEAGEGEAEDEDTEKEGAAAGKETGQPKAQQGKGGQGKGNKKKKKKNKK